MRDFLYLVAIIDWASRKSWPGGCRTRWTPSSALLRWRRQSLGRQARIFNTDQGSQFTARVHQHAGGRGHPHLNGRPRPLDGQRLHRAAVAIAEIRVRVPQCLRDRQRGTVRDRSLDQLYNADRPHSAFAGRTPDEVYATRASEEKLAA